jgi:hypothetical protein
MLKWDHDYMECAMCEGAIKNVNIDAEAKIRKALQL